MLYAGPLLGARAGLGEGSTGGAETQVFLLARELGRRGHRVAIATFEVAPGLPSDVEGVDVIALPARPNHPSRIRQVAWGIRFLVALASIDRCVVVQRGSGAITGLTALMAWVGRRGFVYSSANVIDFEYDQLERNRWALRLFGIGRRLARSIVVQSNEQADLCRRHWGRSSTVIRSLAESASPRSASPEAFLWIARLAPYKRPEIVVELARRIPEAQFWIIGSAAGEHPEVHEQLQRDALELANLNLLEPRPRAELAALYDRAVAVINTSDFEGMSNILLEAWARGVPALVYSHDPDGLVAGEGLGWYADGSLDRLAELAATAWAARNHQGAVGDRCRSYIAREHAASRMAKRWEHVLGIGERVP